MTDDPFDPTLHPLDELASAHLDGVADSAALARVQDGPDFAARLDRLTRARAALRSPGDEVDLTRRDVTIAAALAAFDDRAGWTTNGPPAAISSFEVAEARRRRVPPGWRAAGIAAAIVAGAIAAVPVLTMNDGRPSQELATDVDRSEAATADRTTADDGPSSAYAAGDDALTSALPAPTVPALGEFATYDELADGVRTQLAPQGSAARGGPAPGSTTTIVPPAADGSAGGGTSEEMVATPLGDDCPPPNDDPVIYAGDATVEGQSVTVEVVDDPDGGRTMEVRDPVGNCDVVDSRKL